RGSLLSGLVRKRSRVQALANRGRLLRARGRGLRPVPRVLGRSSLGRVPALHRGHRSDRARRHAGEIVPTCSLTLTDTMLKLTSSPTNHYMSPEWTPDGKYIVVSQAARRFAPYELFLLDLRGGSGVKISPAGGSRVGVAFGADDRFVFYSTGGGFGSWEVEQL